jgi:hypothetical protein
MGSAFSRAQAANGLKKANTATLRSALKNYINAYNKLPTNARDLANIQKLLNTAKNANGITYKNRMATAVAQAVSASRSANVAQKMATSPIVPVPETAAAVVVNNAAKKLENLNTFINGIKNNSNNNKIVKYTAAGRKTSNNRKLNAMKRNNGTSNKYTNLFNKINNTINTKAALSQLPGAGNVGNSGEIRTARTPNKTNNGKNKYIKLIRNTPNSNWKFMNSANNSKYRINQTNKNEPVIKNKNTAQGTTSTNYNTRKSNIGNYIWGRAHGGFGGLAINTNYPKIAANTKAKYPGFPRGIKRENLNAYINSKPKSGQQTERAKAILNVLFAPQSSN